MSTNHECETLLTIASAAWLLRRCRRRSSRTRRAGIGARGSERGRAAARRRPAESQSEKISRTLNIGADGEIDISNISGDIVVTRRQRQQRRVEIVKTARAGDRTTRRERRSPSSPSTSSSAAPAPRFARAIPGIENRRGDRRGMPRRRRVADRGAGRAPASPSGRSRASITVSDIAGALTLETVSGSVRLANTGRLATAKIDFRRHRDGRLEA